MFFFVIFGILAVNYFKGAMMYCYSDFLPDYLFVDNKWECLDNGGVWRNPTSNFDDIQESTLTLFHMATTAGWANIMYRGVDIRGIDLEPEHHNKKHIALFFLCFMVVSSFFILNLYVGVVISTFNREKEKLGKNFLLTDKQKQWVQLKLIVLQSKPFR